MQKNKKKTKTQVRGINFYHQNNIKGTHITCENPISKITTNRDNVWHSRLSSFIKQDCREVIRKSITGEKHIVDVFCKDLNKGIEVFNMMRKVNRKLNPIVWESMIKSATFCNNVVIKWILHSREQK